MTDREPDALSRYLDGEATRAELPAALREEADAFDRIRAAMDPGPVKLPPGLRATIMARVRAAHASPWRRAWRWVTTPTVRVSPLTGTLAFAALAALILWARPQSSRLRERPVETTGHIVARFVYRAPTASSVVVTGEFARWDPSGVAMRRVDGGTWVAEIELTPGLHHYAFVVDGKRWVIDPNATSQVDDGFGQQNSVLLIPNTD